jgi:hypothetical protein
MHCKHCFRKYCYSIIALIRSESSDLDRTAERMSNSRCCSYSAKLRGSKSERERWRQSARWSQDAPDQTVPLRESSVCSHGGDRFDQKCIGTRARGGDGPAPGRHFSVPPTVQSPQCRCKSGSSVGGLYLNLYYIPLVFSLLITSAVTAANNI